MHTDQRRVKPRIPRWGSGRTSRWARNADAPKGGPTLLSAFFKPVNEKDAVRFAEGHGFGHGVGLCQWGGVRHLKPPHLVPCTNRCYHLYMLTQKWVHE